jgi:hypothetical protein
MQTSPYHPAFVSFDGGGQGVTALGALGAGAGAAIAAGAGGKAAAVGATSLATYAGAGAVAGPIGMVVGLVVGIVLSKLLTKNYLNVGQMNEAEGNEIAAFNQYRTIMGQAPGRQFGLPAMVAVWKGALHSGFWPHNQVVQCFHDGCSAHGGDAGLIDMVVNGGCGDRNCFPDLLPAFIAGRTSSLVQAPQTTSPALQRTIQPLNRRPGVLFGLRGLGQLGQAAPAQPVPDAVSFIDNYFIPANSPGSPCAGPQSSGVNPGCYWAAPSSALEHQILYDVADAYLAQQAISTTPFIASSVAAAQPQTANQLPPPPVAVIPAGSTVVPGVAAASPVNPVLNPAATPLLPALPPAVASGVVTTVNAATNANLDAAMASQGFTRIGTDPTGFPIYSQGGNSYIYENGQLFPYGSLAQVAATGNAGYGLSTPATGIDPTTAALIAALISQGMSPAQAVAAATQQLQSQGVPVTPLMQSQLYAAAGAPPGGLSSNTVLLGIGAVMVLMLVTRK